MKEKFLNVYPIVFDEQGYVKNCGRHACMELIHIADQLAPGVDHGNAQTGVMNVQSMRDLYEKLTN